MTTNTRNSTATMESAISPMPTRLPPLRPDSTGGAAGMSDRGDETTGRQVDAAETPAAFLNIIVFGRRACGKRIAQI
jgi:hypothetical protein